MLAAEQLKDMHGREKDLVGLDAEGLHVHSCTHASERHATRSRVRVLAHRGHGRHQSDQPKVQSQIFLS